MDWKLKSCALAFLSLSALAFTPYLPLWGGSVVPSSTYLVNQNFETPGFDNGEAWGTNGTGVANAAYTNAPLVGISSLRITQLARATNSFTASDEVWGYFQFKFLGLAVGGEDWIMWLNEGIGTMAMTLDGNPPTLSFCGSHCATTFGTLSPNTVYHIWFHYKKGTPTGQISEVAFSTDGIKPKA